MELLKSLVLQFTRKIKINLKSNIYLTNIVAGVFTVVMKLFNVKIIKKIFNAKVIIIKTGIFLSLATYWSVILVGTFITFN